MAKTILTVDDSSSIRAMVAFTLKNKGFNLQEAVDGKQALELCKTNKFDLILTDQNMPNMTGLEFIKAVRALPAYAKTPILMLTTEASETVKAQGRQAGATGWLVKPFDPNKLIDVIGKVLP